MSRLFSKQYIEFTVPGRPWCIGNQIYRSHLRAEGTKMTVGQKQNYINLIKFYTKAAMDAQGWKPIDKTTTVYIVLTIKVRPSTHINTGKEVQIAGKKLASRRPTIESMIDMFCGVFKGLVYQAERQIIGLQVVRRVVKKEDECVEVLIGVADTWGELNHDLRNA